MPNTAAEPVHVAVAIIVKDGRVLLSKRAEHVHQGGLWEFPGGKVEPGETSLEALSREIKEELGIHINASRPLINIMHHYADKSVLLETHLVTDFDGIDYVSDRKSAGLEQTGLEGQKVAWVAFNQLQKYSFPEANKAIINALLLPDIYLITPDCQQESIDSFIQQFIASIGSDALVQVRLPALQAFPQPLQPLVARLSEISQEKNTRLLLNSSLLFDENGKWRTDLTDLSSGVHLTGRHLYELQNKDLVRQYRQQFPEKIIAASCHNKQDIVLANRLEVDFIVLSPVQKTSSHPEKQAMGWQQFSALTELAKMPVFALGGMSLDDIELARANGAQGISAIRGLWQFNTGK